MHADPAIGAFDDWQLETSEGGLAISADAYRHRSRFADHCLAPGPSSRNRRGTAATAAIRATASRPVSSTRERILLRQSFYRSIPAYVWRQTAEATNQQPSFKTRDLLRPNTTVVRQRDHKARIANRRGRGSLQRARIPLPVLTDMSLESQL